MKKRVYDMGLLIILAIVLFYGASVQEKVDVAKRLALNATSGQLRTMGSLIQTEEVTELLKAATERVIWAESQAEVNLHYIPEMGYRRAIEGGGMTRPGRISQSSSYACWKDWLIIGENIYKKKNGVYKKTAELWEELGLENSGEIRQYENLVITVNDDAWEDNRAIFHILNLDTWEKTEMPFTGDREWFPMNDWRVFEGKIFYIPSNPQSIHSIELSSGVDEIVYVLDEAAYPSHMIYDYAIRDDGTIMAVVRSVVKNDNGVPIYDPYIEYWPGKTEYADHHIEFWMITHNDKGNAEQKIWETDVYAYVDMVDFNRQGFFFGGTFADRSDSIEYAQEYGGVMWIKENGEMMQLASRNNYRIRMGGFYLTESNYYLLDCIEDPESVTMNSLHSNEYASHVDAVTKYDFEGNELGTHRLVDEEVLEEGWYLLDLICYNDEITAFYAKDGTDELYISQIRAE